MNVRNILVNKKKPDTSVMLRNRKFILGKGHKGTSRGDGNICFDVGFGYTRDYTGIHIMDYVCTCVYITAGCYTVFKLLFKLNTGKRIITFLKNTNYKYN